MKSARVAEGVLFHQHTTAGEMEGANTTLDWTILDSFLCTSSQICPTCDALDHSDLECALHHLIGKTSSTSQHQNATSAT